MEKKEAIEFLTQHLQTSIGKRINQSCGEEYATAIGFALPPPDDLLRKAAVAAVKVLAGEETPAPPAAAPAKARKDQPKKDMEDY